MIVLIIAVPVAGQNIIRDIPLPGRQFARVPAVQNSFGSWLREQNLKAQHSPVLDYRGRNYKSGEDSTVAYVMNIDIANRRIEQCMDILVRLYAEYSWSTDKADQLILPLPGGYLFSWLDWAQGWRPEFEGIKLKRTKPAKQDTSYQNFERYLRTIYVHSHTQQFYHAYNEINTDELQIGDFIVKKGSKAHAVMIVDICQDQSGNKMMLVGHGDTPACQFYLLNYKEGQPWFPVDYKQEILPLPIRRKMSWSGLRRFNYLKNVD